MSQKIILNQQENTAGDASVAAQGFGRVDETPPPRFNPQTQQDEICAFFESNGFAVIEAAISPEEIRFLNDFIDRTQRDLPDAWGLGVKRKPHHRNQGLIFSQPLLDHPELDIYVRHPSTFPVASRLLGDQPRFAEFNFRETPAGGGKGSMNFHHDAVVEDRLLRKPYSPCDYLCAIHYLSDVGPDNPAFCVVPGSHHFETLKEAFDALGKDYREVPLRGPAGTCVLYDTAIFHTRLDGDGELPRRTWHQYYARGGWLQSSLPTTDRYMRAPTPVLTDWNLFPERLAMNPDPEIRLFFSHWNTAQGEWAASGFDSDVRAAMPRGHQ
ncbi:MAG: phytanoyl-CoA dioxygenase family protein [Pseudomonadales bacterium]|nr:phytanoyl-CoA dioxygenase family protein [Pseudomonadales bacterium]